MSHPERQIKRLGERVCRLVVAQFLGRLGRRNVARSSRRIRSVASTSGYGWEEGRVSRPKSTLAWEGCRQEIAVNVQGGRCSKGCRHSSASGFGSVAEVSRL